MKAEDFMCLTKHKAQDFAEKLNMIFRLVSLDGEIFLGYPKESEEIRTDRICVELEKGRVVKATIQ